MPGTHRTHYVRHASSKRPLLLTNPFFVGAASEALYPTNSSKGGVTAKGTRAADGQEQ